MALSKTKKIGGILLILFIGIQFYKVEVKTTDAHPEDDLLKTNPASREIVSLLESACYDCHSEQTKFPWYNGISPIQWWLADHVNHGKKHLNFSAWGSYSAKKKQHKIDECIEMLQAGEMPLNSYTWTHADARLSDEQVGALIDWFGKVR